MAVTLGDGDFRYEVEEGWEQLPEGVTLRETPGVAVNARDEVFLLTRNTDYPVMVFDRQGSFLRSFGRGVFDARTHGMFIRRGRGRLVRRRWDALDHEVVPGGGAAADARGQSLADLERRALQPPHARGCLAG